MYILYQLNSISLEDFMKNDGHSSTVIKNNLWKYHYFITYILHKRRYTVYSNDYVRLSIEKLNKELGSTKIKNKTARWVDIIRTDLKNWGIIKYRYELKKTDAITYKVSFAKLLDEAIAAGWSKWNPTNINKRMNMILSTNRVVNYDHLTGIYSNIPRSLTHVTVEYEAAKAYILSQRGKALPDQLNGWFMETNRTVNDAMISAWLTAIKSIQDGYYPVTIEFKDSGRVYTTVTSFPRALRQFLRINNKPLIGLDVSNSQPLLFALYLKRNYPTLTPDMVKYIELCETGNFYNHIKELLKNNNIIVPTDGFKAEFFAKIFYSKEKVNHVWRTIFTNAFPTVAAAISRVKGHVEGQRGGEPSKLSAQLSLLESEIMIKGVARKLYEAGIYEFVTVHDAIFTNDDYADIVYNIILEEFRAHGINPNVKLTEELILNQLAA